MSESVTKEQYEFFRSLYDEEERTSVQLESRSKVYLGVISAVIAAILLKADDARKASETLHVPWRLPLAEALVMAIALIVVLYALRFQEYQAVSDGVSLIDDYADGWPDEAEFYRQRIAEYAAASYENRMINKRTATLLQWTSRLMMIGIFLIVAMVLFAIRRS